MLHALKRPGAALLAATTLYGTATLYGAPAAAADEPGWSAGPATARPGPARPAFYLTGPAGTVLEDRLALDNPGDREHTVTLRGADAHHTPDGALAVRPAAPGAGARPAGSGSAAGSWISFGGATTVKLPPRTRAVVPFTVTVPPAAPPGDHPAAVVASEAGRRETGVRVHLRVGGPAVAALTVEDVSVRGHGAATVIDYTLVNRGNVALAPELALSAEGTLREIPARPARTLPVELPPGRRARLSEPWPAAPALDRVALTLTVTAPGAAPATATAPAWLAPSGRATLAAGALLTAGGTVLAALLLVRARRARRSRRAEPYGPPGSPQARDPEHAHAHAHEHELTGAPR
ncbi:hypothetical protein ACFY7H_18320 [Streptomyces sp. NPDC012794]|uniref:COG1470 family protein n=1 Tax=Streptomyces sp. NPDC012794 TaxID=3364850 RepID=UPI0036B4EDCD